MHCDAKRVSATAMLQTNAVAAPSLEDENHAGQWCCYCFWLSVAWRMFAAL